MQNLNKVLLQRCLHRLMAFHCETFQFWIHIENANSVMLEILYLYASVLHQNNRPLSQVPKQFHQEVFLEHHLLFVFFLDVCLESLCPLKPGSTIYETQ